ncbi:putative uncharacterized protein [Acidiphilium sp. CAG:727]|nr:putative uncharacterized protein [Acidiphilium sp. CAG:727]
MNIKLFDNELIKEETPLSQVMTEQEINDKYINGEIRIVTEQGRYPLEEVFKMFSNKSKYNDITDYQRNYVWSTKSRSLLIESFIMNVPIPPIFLYERDYSFYEILDGKQRISSIVKFYNNEFALEGLEVWSELNGKKYSTLPIRIKEGLDRRYLSSIIMLKESAKDAFEVNKLKKMVFERLNSGGEKLYPQESRNAVFGGPFNDLCKELAKNRMFRLSWGFKKNKLQISLFEDDDEIINNDTIHMKDVELVLRFFAFRQLDKFENNLNNFLDVYLNNANNYSFDLLTQLKRLFLETIDFAYTLFDGHPFRLWSTKNNRQFSSKFAVRTIYDPLMQVLSQYLSKKNILLNKRITIQQDYISFLIEHEDDFSGKYQHKATIEKRIALFDSFIEKYI